MSISKCKRCGAMIGLIRTDKCSYMAVEADPVDYWSKDDGDDILIDKRGHIINCSLTGEGMPEGVGYHAHWCKGGKR